MPASFKLTNGDLYSMDCLDLREHVVAYMAANGEDQYVWNIASFIACQIDLEGEEVMADLRQDLVLA